MSPVSAGINGKDDPVKLDPALFHSFYSIGNAVSKIGIAISSSIREIKIKIPVDNGFDRYFSLFFFFYHRVDNWINFFKIDSKSMGSLISSAVA